MTHPLTLAFGTMQFGGRADETASRAMFDACLAAGVTHFDTACGYTEGASETLLGRFAAAQREGAECLVTTEKDAVRIAETRLCPLPLFYLRLEIDIIRGAADFDEAVGRICFPQSGAR